MSGGQADPRMVYKKGSNQEITTGLRVREFQCRCRRPECKDVVVDGHFIVAFNKLRRARGHALWVNSGHRCKAHNKEEGGKDKSFHLSGEAIDLNAEIIFKESRTEEEKKKDVEVKDLSAERKQGMADEFIMAAHDAGFTFVKYYPTQGFFHLDTGKRG